MSDGSAGAHGSSHDGRPGELGICSTGVARRFGMDLSTIGAWRGECERYGDNLRLRSCQCAFGEC